MGVVERQRLQLRLQRLPHGGAAALRIRVQLQQSAPSTACRGAHGGSVGGVGGHDGHGLAHVHTGTARDERVRARGRLRLQHVGRVRARARRALGHVPMARPSAARAKRAASRGRSPQLLPPTRRVRRRLTSAEPGRRVATAVLKADGTRYVTLVVEARGRAQLKL